MADKDKTANDSTRWCKNSIIKKHQKYTRTNINKVTFQIT